MTALFRSDCLPAQSNVGRRVVVLSVGNGMGVCLGMKGLALRDPSYSWCPSSLLPMVNNDNRLLEVLSLPVKVKGCTSNRSYLRCKSDGKILHGLPE